MVDDGSTILVVPICDGSHIFSFVINVISKEIVYIDSIPTAKRSNDIQRFLANVIFDDEGMTFSRFYDTRIQLDDSHSCGAWMLGGVLGYVIGITPMTASFHRDNIFTILQIFVIIA